MEEILASIRRIIAEDQAAENSVNNVQVNQTPVDASHYLKQESVLNTSSQSVSEASLSVSENVTNLDEEQNLSDGMPIPPVPLRSNPITPLPSGFPLSGEQNLSEGDSEAKRAIPLRAELINQNTEKSSGSPTSLDNTALHLSSLLSKQTDEAISASFGKLSKVSAQPIQHISVDEFLKQMLRPMLKDWLDSNLPRVVENLVQAEIERAIRSGNMRIGK